MKNKTVRVKGIIFTLAIFLALFLSPYLIEGGSPAKIDLNYISVYEIGTTHTAGQDRTGGTLKCSVGGGDLDGNCPVATPCTCSSAMLESNYYRIEFNITNAGATADEMWGSYDSIEELQGTVDTTDDIWVVDGGVAETCTSSTWASGKLTWVESDTGCTLSLAGDEQGAMMFIVLIGSGATTTSGGNPYGEEDTSADNLNAYVELTIAGGANVAPFVGNASLNETLILLNEYVCLNATSHDPEGDPITVRARVWNTTNFVNFTMVDDGTTGCDGANADTIFGIVVQSGKTGTWNYTHAIANDSNGNFNTTIVNRRWNVTDIPEVTTIDLDDDFVTPLDEIDLIAFGTKNVFCNGTVTDEDGGGDVSVVNATLYDTDASSSGAADSNATHYTNQSCWLSSANGDFRSFECLFRVRYFANNQTWQCNATAYDSLNYQNSSRINATINELIALSVPATINFGTLAPGATSLVNKTNITNAGNILIDLNIYGYANDFTTSDNAMNCTTSAGVKNNISLYFLRYNVTDLPTCSNFGWTNTLAIMKRNGLNLI